ncbi:unnamed protein product [Pseudo-nitzschia multistriata]|uniref:Uncharacterized protein n=1 Tax=Pseudo-nitzschia multistriata TaxID=183589 RepID=A0A448Z3I3_9STRA|nr:unnamed protein product [Pseudo-nitzschia multistriata]
MRNTTIGNDHRRRGLKRELSPGAKEGASLGPEREDRPSKGLARKGRQGRSGSSPLRFSSFAASWLLLAACLCSSVTRVACSDDAYGYYGSNNDDASNNNYNNNYYGGNNYNNNNNNYNNNGNNYGGNYNNNYNGNNNNNNDDGGNNYNYNGNNNNDDANANANDDANNVDYYDYEAPGYDDEYNKQWEDDNIDLDVDGFDGVSIAPVSCVNYLTGHFIKFELYETENSYQCHFGQIGTFVVSIAHYMRAYFNYQALTYGNAFSLPDDVGYLNCIPLKMEKYGYGDDDVNGDDASGDDANGDDAAEDQDQESGDEDENESGQAVLYAKVGCLAKETFSSNTFQLHLYTDDKCTEPYDDGQTDQQHANKGYLIDLDTYYDAKDGDDAAQDDGIRYTDYPQDKRTLLFSTKVSFRPSFYTCQSCKPPQISQTFNKFAGNYYDDMFISQYGMTQSAYNAYLEEKAEQEAAAAECNNCQYFHYSADDSVDDFSSVNDDGSSANDDVQALDDAYYNAVDDYSYQSSNNYNNGNDDGNGRRLTSTTTTMTSDEPRRLGEVPSAVTKELSSALVPVQSELEKFESEFWTSVDAQLEDRERFLYENKYGGVDSWNICEQVYKYGLYCDEECQSLDAFKTDQWSGANIVLLSIMCTFMGAMVMLVVSKRLNAARKARRQKSFFDANDFDMSASGIDTSSIPGLPPMAMFTMFGAVMVIITVLASLHFVNETLVFAVVCCILLFIYMLKITLFSARKRPVLLTSPNHEDVFGYNNADDDFSQSGRRGFFS